MIRSLRGPRGWLALAIVAGLAGSAAQAQAQNAVINGRVTSEQGQPLHGANVYITELNISVGTNEAGNYVINIPAPRVQGQTVQLRIRSVGFTPQSRPITISAGTQSVNFEMKMDATRLAEVVVTGVTAATEQIRVPFTVSKVDSSQMPVAGASVVNQLQGKVPGAHIVSATGRPGSAPTVILRGPVSLNAQGRSQSPLYIVDGVLLNGALPDLNPNDIESMEVVKGAAAASIYGARAGAGVINITTKSGKNTDDGVRFGVRTEMGASDIEREFPLAKYSLLHMDPSGKMFCANVTIGGSPCGRLVDMEDEARRVNDNLEDYALPPQGFLGDAGIARAALYPQLTGSYQVTPWPKTYDAVKQLTTANQYMNTTADVTGRVGQGTSFYGSFGNSRQQGALRFMDGYTRNSARLKVDQRWGEKFTLSLNTYYAQTQEDGANLDETGSGGPWFSITRTPAFANPIARDSRGRLYIRHNVLNQGDQNLNPAYPVENDRRIDQGNRFIGGLTGRYVPVEWLTLDGNFSYDRNNSRYTRLRDKGYRATNSSPSTHYGSISNVSSDGTAFNTSFGATARHNFTADFDAALSGRLLYDQRDGFDESLYGEDLAVPGLMTADAAKAQYSVSSGVSSIRNLAYLGAVDLGYKERYFINGSIRRDGSSLFGVDHRWATFGRGGLAWVASKESWFPEQNVVSMLRLRSSYGTSGQSPRFTAQYETYTLGAGGTLNPSTLGNPKLKPEVNAELEVGGNLELFGRYGLEVVWSKATVSDQILPVKLPSSMGFANQWQNAGELQSKTWEVTLDVPVINTPKFSYSTRVIWDRTSSVITKLNVLPFTGDVTAANTYTIYQFREGEKIGTFYGTDFVRSCSQLPSAFQGQCGGANSAFRRNNEGYIVWVGEGNSFADGITKNLWTSNLPGAQAPWGVRANWGMPMVRRDDATAAPLFAPLGNSIPDFHLGWAHNIRWKKFSAFALLNGAFGQEVWNIGYHWSLGDFMTAGQDQYGKSVEDAKPIGYWWRRGPGGPAPSSGVGGFYDALGPSRYSVEDGSYVKLREMSVTYQLGPVGGVGNWNLGVVGRNLHTWTKFRGWDPEAGVSGGLLNSAAINAVAGYRFPSLRTFTVQLSTTF